MASWLEERRDELVAMQAFKIAFSPQSSWTDSDPGSGDTVTLAFSYLTPSELIGMGELWARSREPIRLLGSAGWTGFSNWCGRGSTPTRDLSRENEEDTEVTQALRLVADRMLRDIAALARDRPGVQQKLKSYAAAIGATIPGNLDPDYEVLFPGGMISDWISNRPRRDSWLRRNALQQIGLAASRRGWPTNRLPNTGGGLGSK